MMRQETPSVLYVLLAACLAALIALSIQNIHLMPDRPNPAPFAERR